MGRTVRRRCLREAVLRLRLAPAALWMLFPAACSRESASGPPRIAYGEDICATCRMIISEERFAAAVRAGEPGRAAAVFLFDDIGCMIRHERDHPGATVLVRYVHDYARGGWIEAERAWYVRNDEIRSPMGFGIAAFGSESEAVDALGRGSGRPMRLEELQALESRAKLLPRLAPGRTN